MRESHDSSLKLLLPLVFILIHQHSRTRPHFDRC
jgi:hypothetical protein